MLKNLLFSIILFSSLSFSKTNVYDILEEKISAVDSLISKLDSLTLSKLQSSINTESQAIYWNFSHDSTKNRLIKKIMDSDKEIINIKNCVDKNWKNTYKEYRMDLEINILIIACSAV